MRLLFAGTLKPNTTPRSVHEIRFDRPAHIEAFRIVCEGERPHTEISFEGSSPAMQMGIEMFGCEHGSSAICKTLLRESHQPVERPSPLQPLSEGAKLTRCNYLVIRYGLLHESRA